MRVGIIGYGNLGRAVETVARDMENIEIVGVFTRRSPSSVETLGAKIFPYEDVYDKNVDADVMILCQGSSGDIPEHTPKVAKLYNTVDTFDNHGMIEIYKQLVDKVSRENSHVSIVSAGWDPGFLSLMRLYLSALLPNSSVNTFWGRGVSQGHSEALRGIPGVKKAIQYTVPKAEALTLASLVCHPLEDTDRHKRVCYIAVEKGKEDDVKQRVLSFENYFSGYDTEIHFIEENDPLFDKTNMSHRGRIYALGQSGVYKEHKYSAFFDLELSCNPELTAHIALTAARVCQQMHSKKLYGAHTFFDILPSAFYEINGKNANKYL